MGLNGIDISGYQKGIDLGKLNGVDFVIIKATQGRTYLNPAFKAQITQALDLGKLVGVYHYVSGIGAKDEAQWFYDNIKPYLGQVVICIDWEEIQNSAWGNLNYLDQLMTQINGLTGVPALIYASKAVFPWDLAKKHNAGAWVAQYANDNATGFQAVPWNEGAYTCAIRQYTANGYLDGWGGALDLDKAYMTREAWAKYANPGGTVSPAPKPVAPSAPKLGGQFKILVDGLNVRSKPSLSASVVAHYNRGEKVWLDSTVTKANGWYWGTYIGASGKRRYIAVQSVDGKHVYAKRA
jgi:GH25 family lysozyme M1 (1,4-beta-N-acetylmuramidase)